MNKKFSFVSYTPPKFSNEKMVSRSLELYQYANKRRSVRNFSNKPVPREVMINIIKTAGTAPSGANKQPWTFVIVSNQDLKHKIRLAAEKEEKLFYEQRISEEWKKDLIPLGTDMNKQYLDVVPYLIVVFRQDYGIDINDDQLKKKHYYVMESVGIAVGMLIQAIHNAGLVTLTHTPSPMKFLRDILGRPKNEKPFVLMPVGLPAEDIQIPDVKRKEISEIAIWK